MSLCIYQWLNRIYFVVWLFFFSPQAILENNLPSEIVSKINLVDLAGRWNLFPFIVCPYMDGHIFVISFQNGFNWSGFIDSPAASVKIID